MQVARMQALNYCMIFSAGAFRVAVGGVRTGLAAVIAG